MQLEALSLRNTGIDSKTLARVCTYLARNVYSLKWLDLSYHPFSEKYAKHNEQVVVKLTEVITNCALTHIDLSGLNLQRFVFVIV